MGDGYNNFLKAFDFEWNSKGTRDIGGDLVMFDFQLQDLRSAFESADLQIRDVRPSNVYVPEDQ